MYNSIITNDIQYIFQVFNYMSMTDFASLLGINRSTTYSYLEFSKCYNLSAKKNLILLCIERLLTVKLYLKSFKIIYVVLLLI